MTTEQQISAALTALGFNNPSNVALFEKTAQGIGIPIDNTITEINNAQAAILNIINTQRYGKSGYYTGAAKAFQYGDNLIVDPTTLDYVYAVIDPTKQIINQAAFEEIVSGNSSQLFLKVATLDTTSGLLVPLTSVQLSAFSNYFGVFEIPGLPVTIINNAANILSFNATCTYYATYDFPTLQANLAAALESFQNSFAFNGEFFNGDLQDYIKANVPGVRDFFISNTLIDGVAFSGSTVLGSGYFDYIANIINNVTYSSVNG
jgi:hypothetical protein